VYLTHLEHTLLRPNSVAGSGCVRVVLALGLGESEPTMTAATCCVSRLLLTLQLGESAEMSLCSTSLRESPFTLKPKTGWPCDSLRTSS
jgi:hypothetical protein